MKRFIIVLAIALIMATSTMAPAIASPTQASMDEMCSSEAEFAYFAMQSRQDGVSFRDKMESLNKEHENDPDDDLYVTVN